MLEIRNYSYTISDNSALDIPSRIISELYEYTQRGITDTESCGYLLGYVNTINGSITVTKITTPGKSDIRNRYFCRLRDHSHYRIMKREAKKKNYFLGTWHTHPQGMPYPSSTDITDWKKTLDGKHSVYECIFFVIIGTEQLKIWCGFFKNKSICELNERNRNNGLYI